MYGKETREKIIEQRKQGWTIRKIALENGVSERMIYRLIELYQKTGSVAPRTSKTCGRPGKLTQEMLDQICKAIDNDPGITIQRLQVQLDLPICVSNLNEIVREKLGYVYKGGERHRRSDEEAAEQ